MKKTLFTLFVILLGITLMYGYANAVSGVCSNCHTMHNSQDGAEIDADGPNDYLLNAGCVACHTDDTGMTSSFGAPAVLHTTTPSGQGNAKTNAGGDFKWVSTTDSTGHNVADISGLGADGDLASPPGFAPGATTSFPFGAIGTTWTSQQVTCAGTYGCHGNHTVGNDSWEGIKGAHHGNTDGSATQAATASSVGNSYRFLAGIKGLENADWNWNETAGTHNEYKGENNTGNRTANGAWGATDTISFLCAECHGDFHGTIDVDSPGASPWRRHPTDIVLPDASEYAGYTTYSVEAPVARGSVPATSSSTVDPGDATNDDSAIVMCLSCHRAHGSPEPDLLRWTYTDMVAGNGGSADDTGCFVCHLTKD